MIIRHNNIFNIMTIIMYFKVTSFEHNIRQLSIVHNIILYKPGKTFINIVVY